MSWHLKEKLQKYLQAETGTIVFAPGARTGFALVYPNTYEVGMSNLGMHIIYQQINSRSDTSCERFFLPDSKTLTEYARTNTPLMSIENQLPLHKMDLIGFAVSFEMDYFNVIAMLEIGKVTLLSCNRGEEDPIIIMGGPCATFNPEPLADIADVFIIGEGEETIHAILDSYYEGRRQERTRYDILLDMAQLAGVYVPRFYQPLYSPDGIIQQIDRLDNVPPQISRQWIKDIDSFPAHSIILTDQTEFQNKFLIEVARGCGRHCRFCMAGYCFRRPRNRSLDNLKKVVDYAATMSDRVGLMGAAISDYPDIDLLCDYILQQGLSMSVASFRADSLSVTLMQSLASSGHKTITIAPEAGSSRLRNIINKNISADDIVRAVDLSIRSGVNNIRLYFMIGLPFEQDQDIDAIITMAKQIKQQMSALGSKGKLTLSINPFVPKPFTPFQWLPMNDLKDTEFKLKQIKSALKSIKGIEVLVESVKEAYIQAVLARGDRRLGELLIKAHNNGGPKGWRTAIKGSQLDESFYLYRERSKSEILPWQHIDTGVTNQYLLQELAKSAEEIITVRCADNCRRCGVCN